jgi:hypothetical protein
MKAFIPIHCKNIQCVYPSKFNLPVARILEILKAKQGTQFQNIGQIKPHLLYLEVWGTALYQFDFP